MKNILGVMGCSVVLLMVLGSMPVASASYTTGSTTVAYTSTVDNFSLSYLEWLPTGYMVGHSYPLAVFLHGAGTSSTWTKGGVGASTDLTAGMIKTARSAGFIFVSLNTRTSDGFYSNTPCGGPQEQDVLDAVVHEKVLRAVTSVFLIGFSMGSLGALTLVAEHPTMFAGIALAGTITDAFEVQVYDAVHRNTNPGWASTLCGASLLKHNATAAAWAYHWSPLRFYPQNFTSTMMYLVGGGKDVRAPNNFAVWPFADVNNTVDNVTCHAETTYGEPADCTTPLSTLNGSAPWLDVWEPAGTHSVTELYMPSVFQFFLGALAGGYYHAAFPPTQLLPGK